MYVFRLFHFISEGNVLINTVFKVFGMICLAPSAEKMLLFHLSFRDVYYEAMIYFCKFRICLARAAENM